MGYKVIMKVGKKTLVSDHRKKSAAEEYKAKILRARKAGKLPKNLTLRLRSFRRRSK